MPPYRTVVVPLALLVRFAPDYIADAFCVSRLTSSPFGGGAFGDLPAGTDFAAILERAWPA
jgi:putative acyl-CoA dehydrogenase